jgi:hypothetical protein
MSIINKRSIMSSLIKGKKAKLTMLILIVATMITFVPLLITYNVKEATAATVPNTSAGQIYDGYGTGKLICSNGLSFNNEQIHFEVTKNKGERAGVGAGVVGGGGGARSLTAGNWGIHTISRYATEAIAGSINEVVFSSSPSTPHNNIIIKGTEHDDSICNKSASSVVLKTNYVTISGQCDIKGTTTISFIALDGKKGTFQGSIICDKIR